MESSMPCNAATENVRFFKISLSNQNDKPDVFVQIICLSSNMCACAHSLFSFTFKFITVCTIYNGLKMISERHGSVGDIE